MKINELLHPEVKKIFYNWLEKHGARENYKTAIQLVGNNNYNNYLLCEIINWSFAWDRTPSRHSYWWNLHCEWRNYILDYLHNHPKFRKWVRDNNIDIH